MISHALIAMLIHFSHNGGGRGRGWGPGGFGFGGVGYGYPAVVTTEVINGVQYQVLPGGQLVAVGASVVGVL